VEDGVDPQDGTHRRGSHREALLVKRLSSEEKQEALVTPLTDRVGF
jgi:hypothetical protein